MAGGASDGSYLELSRALGLIAMRAGRSAHVGTVAYKEFATAAFVADAPNVFVAANGSRRFSRKQYFHLLG